ncbi:uric acid degradation bifunctional protein TTL-like [Arachis ipaensis]|uniref:uric acid degradation bifunctional protein TTL-like n=1 Tax=Arachis ipaensis TaxID=130454 RepID=UPI0007AF3873|nr:uric acid degradation bifunctional protein TTL-like [Arachis ipaensis]XP_025636148.1 uric acid degradation bifunctional protein TTL-like [Arachis hypogaea]
MASASPFFSLQHALNMAFDVWCNKTNIHSWLIALNAHTNICEKSPFSHAFYTNAPSSAMYSSLDEIYASSVQYLQRFGFLYFATTSDWDGDSILLDLKTSVKNKPACEFEWARRKQFIIIE